MTLLFLPMAYKANTHGHRTLVKWPVLLKLVTLSPKQRNFLPKTLTSAGI